MRGSKPEIEPYYVTKLSMEDKSIYDKNKRYFDKISNKEELTKHFIDYIGKDPHPSIGADKLREYLTYIKTKLDLAPK